MRKLIVSICLLASCTSSNRYSLSTDNDLFKPTENRDEAYTNGLRIRMEHQVRHGLESLYALHTFYTPRHKHEPRSLAGERPYAGYLAAGYARTRKLSPFDQWGYGVEAGVVGPWALGKQVQREVHSLLGQSYPAGWDSQLHNEPALTVIVKRSRVIPLRPSTLDLTFTGELDGGNIFDQVVMATRVRAGDLSHAQDSGPIFPRGPLRTWRDVSAYGYVEFLGRYVLRNLFLDGNSFRASPSVDRKLLVGEARIGIAVQWGVYDISYQYMLQTPEYETEPQGQDFGEITIGVSW